jgi:hypothetical protein
MKNKKCITKAKPKTKLLKGQGQKNEPTDEWKKPKNKRPGFLSRPI